MIAEHSGSDSDASATNADSGWSLSEAGSGNLGHLGVGCVPDDECNCEDGAIGIRVCSVDDGGANRCECAADAGLVAGSTTTLYVHGRNDGTPIDWGYWNLGPRPGVNAVPVNWAGNGRLGSTNLTVRDALDTYCTGANWCFIACHSAGCAQVGYALDRYGVRADVETWNIYWVAAAGSAAGGSEVADLKLWSTHFPIDEDLKTAAMRGDLYNHDNTAGVTHFMFAGAGYSDAHPGYDAFGAKLPGNDDDAVAYHSSCGINNSAYYAEDTWCSSSPCLGSYVAEGSHSYLWAMHDITFLDVNQVYSHYIDDSNEGICSVMFDFMEQNAW